MLSQDKYIDFEEYEIPKDNYFDRHRLPFVNHNKIRRNVLCSCGSGLKWKKCCFLKQNNNGKITS